MDTITPKPIILREGDYSADDLDSFKKANKIEATKDIYIQQLTELFEIQNPHLIFSADFKRKQREFVGEKQRGDISILGNWIYFPWNKTLLHTVTEKEYFLLRTNRNKEIITEEEQEKLNNFCVGVLGLSVGGNVAINLAHAGISNSLKLSDFDTLDTTNLNRVRSRLDQVGELKTSIISQQIYEINPYAALYIYEKGLNDSLLESFFAEDKKVDLIFDIIDDFKMKIKLRLCAKEKRVPLIMLTNLGDSVLVDIERYDTNPDLPIFNGKIGDMGNEILENEISKEDEKRYAIDIVGKENIPPKVLQSVQSIGDTLVGRPQLIGTVSISAGIGTYFTKKIALNDPVPSGRTLVKFNEFIKE